MQLFLIIIVLVIVYILLNKNNKETFKWGKGLPIGQEYSIEPVSISNAQQYINLLNKESNAFDLNDINETNGSEIKNKYNQTCNKGCQCSDTLLNIPPMIFPRGTSYYSYPY